MAQFRIHDKNSAPAASGPMLVQTEKGFGFIPNVITQKTLSNYANHIMATLLDEVFAEHTWAAPAI